MYLSRTKAAPAVLILVAVVCFWKHYQLNRSPRDGVDGGFAHKINKNETKQSSKLQVKQKLNESNVSKTHELT